MSHALNIDFTAYKTQLVIRERGNQKEVFDPVRRKYVVLQPEELVRQLVVKHFLESHSYPLSKIRVEMGLTVNERQKRCDILVFDKLIQPFLLVECKSAFIKIDHTVFEQIARYNLTLRVPFLMVTNGLTTYCCAMDYDQQTWTFIETLPSLS
jgi:hypothetical protein